MRPSGKRSETYAKKIRGMVIPGQRERFKANVSDQVAAELYVKTLGKKLIQQQFYMIFAKQVAAAIRLEPGGHAQTNAEALAELWEDRGLDLTTLNAIMVHYGLEAIVVPGLFTLDVSLLDGPDVLA